jgi:membrane-associated HD superfamily phosphohydrolase
VTSQAATPAALPAEPGVPTARGRRGLNAVRDTPDWLFYMFMVAFALEYSGLPNQFPILKVARVTTLLTYLSVVITISKVGFGDLFKHKQTKLFMAFLVFTILSTLWAVVRTRAFDQIRPFVDYLFLFYLTASLIDRPKRFRVFGIVICVIVAWLIAKNLGRFGQEERAGAFAAAYFMGDGNDFAWGLVTLLPFMLYLVIGDHGVLLKLAGVAAMGITLFGIVGT